MDDRALDELLKGMAAEHQAQLPSAGLLWWRGQLQRKQREKERIERPLVVMRQLAAATCGAVFVALLAENFGQIQSMLRNESWFLMPLLILTAAVTAVAAAFPVRSRAKR
jgi:hypothetical protein